MAWVYLVAAGLLEIGWAIGLEYSQGFTRLPPSILTVVALIGSMVLLGLAVRDLPIGSAYAIWVGIGTVGTAALGIVLFNESRDFGRLFFLVLLVVALIGLSLTTR